MVLSKLFERRSGTSNPDPWFREWLGGGQATSAGVNVSHNSALSFDAVYSCIKIISETCGMLPLPVYRRLEPRGKERVHEHPLAPLLEDEPNEDMHSMTFWETIVAHAASWGNGYAEIIRPGSSIRGNAYPVEMQIMTPDRVTVERDKATRKIVYRYRPEDTGEEKRLNRDQVFHLLGFGWDGLKGYSPIEYHRQTIGSALANIQHNASFFGRGAMPSGVLKYDGNFKDTQKAKKFREDWDKLNAGSENAYGTAVLTKGMDYTPLTMSARDARTVELFKLNVVQVARIFRMPLHKIQDMDAATFANIEHQSIEFVQDTIMPWLKRIVKEVKRKLFLPTDKATFFVEHIIEELLRGDTLTRYQAHELAIRSGWKSVNEVRVPENLNPIPGGDAYMVQAQMTPLDQIGKDPEPKSTAPPKPPDDDDEDDERTALLAATYRGLFEDLYQRTLRVEGDRLKAAAKREDDFGAWLGPFYEGQKAQVRGLMGAAVDAAGGAMYVLRAGRPVGKDALRGFRDYTSELADRHTQLGYAAAYQAASRGGSVLEAVEAVCEGWADRPARLAEQEVRLLSAAVDSLVELN